MTPSFSPISIRELLVLLGLLLYLTDTNVVAAMHWAVTTRPILWEPLALAALGTRCFDITYQRARKELE